MLHSIKILNEIKNNPGINFSALQDLGYDGPTLGRLYRARLVRRDINGGYLLTRDGVAITNAA